MPPGSVCITSLLDMTINLQLIYKNHPVVRIRISEAIHCKVRCKTDHNWKQKSKQRFISDQIGNILVCEITTHCFFLFVYFSAIMFIFFIWVELFFGLDLPTPGYYCKRLPIEIHTHIRDTYYARVGCCKGECWLLNIFIIHFSIDWVENSIVRATE